MTETVIAPAPEFVRYLATFQRMLTAIQDYTARDDKPGMLLGGHLADALHNVPSLLLNYKQEWNSASEIDKWLRAFPRHIEWFGADERLVRDSERVLSPINAAQDLGLHNDLSDFDLAPTDERKRYLNLLYGACVDMRGMQNFGNYERARERQREGGSPDVWHDLDERWDADAQEQADHNALSAIALQPIPVALVRWKEFDESSYWARLDVLSLQIPEANRERWRNWFRQT